jgi:hypothetical protein
MSFGLMDEYQHFRVTMKIEAKYWYPSPNLHGVTSQNTLILTLTPWKPHTSHYYKWQDGNNLKEVDIAWYLDGRPQKPQSGQLVTQLRFEARHICWRQLYSITTTPTYSDSGSLIVTAEAEGTPREIWGGWNGTREGSSVFLHQISPANHHFTIAPYPSITTSWDVQ